MLPGLKGIFYKVGQSWVIFSRAAEVVGKYREVYKMMEVQIW